MSLKKFQVIWQPYVQTIEIRAQCLSLLPGAQRHVSRKNSWVIQ